MERIVTVVPEAGLHARPAARFVETANQFEADLQIAPADDGDPVMARSMLSVTSLGVECGEDVVVTAEGADAAAALDALEAVLTTPETGDDAASETGDVERDGDSP